MRNSPSHLHNMATPTKAPYSGRNIKSPIRMFLVGFILGVIVFVVLSLARYTEQQLRASSADYDRAVNAMMPFRRGESSKQQQAKCDCTTDHHPDKTQTTKSISNDNGIQDFDPTAPVVIATKIQSGHTLGSLNQSLCLLTFAYNHRVNYDVVVFSATHISDEDLQPIRDTISPARLIFVVDNPGIQAMVDPLPPDRKRHLLDRCNVTDSSQLNWTTRCVEISSSGTTVMPLAYNWQAEFRSLHIWTNPALASYRYMMWMDTDAFCTQTWKQDPIAVMRRNNLVVFFDHFPMGRANGEEWIPKINQAFGKNICEISMRNGTLHAFTGKCTWARNLRQIYGFFHITDLDFYRSEPVMNWQRIMIGNSTFSRKYDDQIAVTLPAAILAGNRSWHMSYFGVKLRVVHNFQMDGDKHEKVGSFKNFWSHKAKHTFPEAYGSCKIVSGG